MMRGEGRTLWHARPIKEACASWGAQSRKVPFRQSHVSDHYHMEYRGAGQGVGAQGRCHPLQTVEAAECCRAFCSQDLSATATPTPQPVYPSAAAATLSPQPLYPSAATATLSPQPLYPSAATATLSPQPLYPSAATAPPVSLHYRMKCPLPQGRGINLYVYSSSTRMHPSQYAALYPLVGPRGGRSNRPYADSLLLSIQFQGGGGGGCRLTPLGFEPRTFQLQRHCFTH